jgi:aspartate/methionine/tyrosine aminotransferase
MKTLSNLANNLEGQPMFQILSEARKLEKTRNILHFELGDPDFDTPHAVTLACVKSLMDGETHYVPSSGMIELKEAAQETTSKSRGFKPDLNQILVTPGANAQIYYAIACTVNPGDEVIIPDPGFASYFSICKMLGVKIVSVPLREINQFRLDPRDVEKAITPNTRMIIMNSPSNPTGSVMTKQEIEHMYMIALVNDVYLLSDEIYARMVYNRRFYSPSVFDNCKQRVIMVNGFSKSYAMTGWRLGVCTGPAEVIEKMGLMLETTTSCVSPFIQRAGIEALRGSQAQEVIMSTKYGERRNVLVDGLNSLKGVHCDMPDGAFYVFPNITGTTYSSQHFANHVLYNANVALCPGTIFGKYGEGYVRMSYANNSIETIKDAIEKMRYIL